MPRRCLPEAALTYYDKAVNAEYKCRAFAIDVCSGLSFPDLATQRISAVNAQGRPPAKR